jgi:hypothetical protein
VRAKELVIKQVLPVGVTFAGLLDFLCHSC